MTNEQVLTQYVQELTNQRTQLEFTILTLKAQIDQLNASKQEGTDQAKSPE